MPMNITRLTLWQVPLTSHIAYNMSDGKICDTVTTNILRLQAAGGIPQNFGFKIL